MGHPSPLVSEVRQCYLIMLYILKFKQSLTTSVLASDIYMFLENSPFRQSSVFNAYFSNLCVIHIHVQALFH